MVDEAVVAKSDVVVAFVVVEFSPVKFCRVDDALTRRLVAVTKPEEVRLPPVPTVKKRFVVEAVVAKRLVEVALVVVPIVTVRAEMVDEA